MKIKLIFLFVLTFSVFGLFAGTEKQNVAIMKLDGRGLAEGEANTLTDALRSYLINTGIFRVMERGKMDVILKEQGFQASGACTDEACLVEMGQLLGVQNMVTGSVGKVGKTFSVNVRMIDIATGEITKTVNKFYKGEIDGLLTDVIPAIASDFAGVSNVKSGSVMKSSDSNKSAEKSEVKKSSGKSGNGLLWVVAGVAVVGGGAAAFLMLRKKEGTLEVTW